MSPIRYAITNRVQYGETELEHRAGLLDQAARLAAEGVDYIQLREKDLSAQNLIGVAREMLSVIRHSHSGTQLLINARADVALACGAHGVHIASGVEQLTPPLVRQLFAHQTSCRRHSDPERTEVEESSNSTLPGDLSPLIISPLISVSCHTLEEIARACDARADLILFGPVFAKSIAGQIIAPGVGLEALEAACRHAGETPVLALGGVTAANAATTIAAGAKGIAAIRLFH